MNNVSDDLFQVLRNLLTQIPSLFALLICLGVGLFRWKRHAKVSLIATLGFVSLILHGVMFSMVYVWLPTLVFGSDDHSPHRTFFTALAIVTQALFALALAILLIAIFIDRPARIDQPRFT